MFYSKDLSQWSTDYKWMFASICQLNLYAFSPLKTGKGDEIKNTYVRVCFLSSILKNFDGQIASSFKFTVVNIETYEICSYRLWKAGDKTIIFF